MLLFYLRLNLRYILSLVSGLFLDSILSRFSFDHSLRTFPVCKWLFLQFCIMAVLHTGAQLLVLPLTVAIYCLNQAASEVRIRGENLIFNDEIGTQ